MRVGGQKHSCRQQGVASVAAGESHSLALGFDGTLWAWGLGNDGQLGHEVIASVMKQNLHTQRPIVLHEPKRVAALRPESMPAQERSDLEKQSAPIRGFGQLLTKHSGLHSERGCFIVDCTCQRTG